ncbi:hypothetical protein LR48_Vigan08g097200 [Vigna angularis]|uniref:Uncharacterized protein n=1 Tax=Phaseolus angularis TaxID=3914 RepID=A0A0L9V4Y1_PHAAN|nr:hypothetical protein LR48_Vigan08g097200 [Vigna angularis]
MLKVTRHEFASLLYAVFISKVLHLFHIECVEESCETYGKRNIMDKVALHHMGLQHGVNGRAVKDENQDEEQALFDKLNKDIVVIYEKLGIQSLDNDDESKEDMKEVIENDGKDDDEESVRDESDDEIFLRDMI